MCRYVPPQLLPRPSASRPADLVLAHATPRNRLLVVKAEEPIQLAQLLTKPAHSIINQASDSRLRLDAGCVPPPLLLPTWHPLTLDSSRRSINADGFGVGWYPTDTDPGSPGPCVFRALPPSLLAPLPSLSPLELTPSPRTRARRVHHARMEQPQPASPRRQNQERARLCPRARVDDGRPQRGEHARRPLPLSSRLGRALTLSHCDTGTPGPTATSSGCTSASLCSLSLPLPLLALTLPPPRPPRAQRLHFRLPPHQAPLAERPLGRVLCRPAG